MGTTASGLRYPEPTDPVSAGAGNMKNLADDVTALYMPEPAVGNGAAAFSPDAAAVPAGAPLRVLAGKLNVTTDAAGQAVVTTSGTLTTAIVGLTVFPAVSLGAPFDTTLSAAARNGNSFYLYVMRGGVKLANTAVGVIYIAVCY